MMKILIPSVTLSLYLFLSLRATDISVNFIQTFYSSSDHVLTLWGSLEVGDIQILAFYNETRQIVFKQSWSNGNLSDTDWMFFTMFLGSYIYYFHVHLDEMSTLFGLKGAFTIQCMAVCPSSTDYPEGYNFKIALNGKVVVYFNVSNGVWVAGDYYPQSKAVEKVLQRDRTTKVSIEKMLKNQCHSMAVTYSTAGMEAFSKKIQPQVYMTRKYDKSGTEVICMVTGFYPKPINVSLWKNNKIEDVMSTETLPNGDGSYQITVLAIENSKEEQNIYCRVEHSSLKEPLIVHLDNNDRISSGLIISIVVAVASLMGLAFLVKYYRRCRKYRSMDGTNIERLSLRRRDGDVSNT